MSETPAYIASFTVLAGPHKGLKLLLDEAIDDVLVGSDPDCRLCLDQPGVSPIHARVWLDPDGAVIYDTHSPAGVYVNDDRVQEKAPLRDGDFVWLGAPGETESVMLQFRHPGASAQPPAPTPAAAPMAAPPAPAPAPAAEPASAEAEPFELELGEPAVPPEEPAVPDAPPPAPPEPQAEAPRSAEWRIAEPPSMQGEPLSGGFSNPLASVLDESAWPAEEPPTLEHGTEEPVESGEFFVAEEQPAQDPSVEPLDESFEWQDPAEDAPGETHEIPPEEPMVLDWPADAPEETPEPAPPTPEPVFERRAVEPPPVEDEDVFYVEEEPLAPAPPAPSPPPAPAPRARPPAEPEPPPRPVAPAPVPPPRPAAAPAPMAAREEGRTEVPRTAPAPRAPATSSRPRARGSRIRMGLVVAVVVLAAAAGGLVVLHVLRAPRIDSIQPARVRAGDAVTIQGRNFASNAAAIQVRFEGRREGRVLKASPTRLEVEVPSIPSAPGRTNRVPVQVQISGRSSQPFEISVFQAPRIHGISPVVALPGEEVTLAGSDWGPGASVRFGEHEAQVTELGPASIRVRVPAVPLAEGTRLPVVVTMGGDPSNEAPFYVGRLPLLLSVTPAAATVGDVLTLKGHGFAPPPSANDVRIGGTPALVVQARESELQVVVPRTPAHGANAIELRVPGAERVAQATIQVAPRPAAVDFRFVAETPVAAGLPDREPAHDHVVLSTGLGPAFVLSAADGRRAADRAVEAQWRLNEAAVALKATLTADLEVRGLDGQPSIGLVGKPEPLLVVTPEDAAGYGEAWTRGAGGEPVTPARLAIWWTAVARDLVLLLVRGEKPRHAAALAAEGRALGTLHDLARRTGAFGVPREVVASAPAGLKEALRTVAFRVPASVSPPRTALSAQPVQDLTTIDGIWSGSESEGSTRRYMTVTFDGQSGTLTYERALALTLPLLSVERPTRRDVRFSFRSGVRLRQYEGRWDGQRIAGRVLSEDGSPIGTFELERKR